jgi:hypothetical protein
MVRWMMAAASVTSGHETHHREHGAVMNTKRSLLLLSLSTLLGCQDPEAATEPRSLSEDVGERIPLDVAERWIGLHREEASEGPDGSASFGATAPQLAVVLGAVPDRRGVALHHALDDDGEHHVLVMAVDQDPRPWSSPTLVLDANTGAMVDYDTACAWAERYEDEHPDQVWYHFFGRTIIDGIVGDPRFDHLDIEPAVNDLGEPQLVLMAWSEDESEQERSRDADPVPYDVSSQCPPCGVE